MQNEFYGSTLNEAINKVVIDTEVKRSRRHGGRDSSHSKQCERRKKHIYDILNQMQRITRELESVSERTMRDIAKAQRATSSARVKLTFEAGTYIFAFTAIIKRSKSVSAAIKNILGAGSFLGIIDRMPDVINIALDIESIAGRLEKIDENSDLVRAGRRLNSLATALKRLENRLQRAVSAYNNADC